MISQRTNLSKRKEEYFGKLILNFSLEHTEIFEDKFKAVRKHLTVPILRNVYRVLPFSPPSFSRPTIEAHAAISDISLNVRPSSRERSIGALEGISAQTVFQPDGSDSAVKIGQECWCWRKKSKCCTRRQ